MSSANINNFANTSLGKSFTHLQIIKIKWDQKHYLGGHY